MTEQVSNVGVKRRGRRPVCRPEVLEIVAELHLQGLSDSQIAVTLNARAIPTPEGKPLWAKHHVYRLRGTHGFRDLMEARDVP